MADTQAAALANINTAIQNVSSLIQQITLNPQPSYSVQGVSVSWADYLSLLVEQQAKLQEIFIFLSGPYELCTQGVS